MSLQIHNPPAPDNSELSRSVARHFMDADRLHHQCVNARIGKLGLHRNQLATLIYLSDCVGSPSQKEIAERFGISAAAVAAALKLLEKSGYIKRESDSSDARRNLVSVTERGREIVEKSKREFEAVDLAMIEGLGSERLHALVEALKSIEENLRRLSGLTPKEETE